MLQLILNLFIYSSLAAVVPDAELTDLEKQGLTALTLIANDQFDEAFPVIEKIKQDYKEAPFYYSFESALYYKIMEEYRTREFENKFTADVEAGIEAFKKLAEADSKQKPLFQQYLGSVYGYRGMYRGLRGEWASAFLDGRRGYNVLELSHDADPKMTDNLSGMGTFLYWRSRKSSFIKYLVLWGDKREEGISLLVKTAKEGRVVKSWSQGGLVRIYIEEERWADALNMANEILGKAPNDIAALRRKAVILENNNQIADSLAIYEKMLVLVKAKKFNTTNVQLETIYNIVRLKKATKVVIDKDAYKREVTELAKTVTPYFTDFSVYIKKINDLIN